MLRSSLGSLKRSLLILVPLLLLAFFLRVLHLDAQPIWWDEAISLHLAESSLGGLIADRVQNIHPPLYYLALKVWVSTVGVGAYTGRFFSVMGSTLTVVVAYALSRQWGNEGVALFSALLVALSPLYVIYGQEIRVYAWLPVVYLLLLRSRDRLVGESSHTGSDWFWFVAFSIVAFYLHYVMVVAIAYVCVSLAIACWPDLGRRRSLLISLSIIALFCLPWGVSFAMNRTVRLGLTGATDPFAGPVSASYALRLVWHFFGTGFPDSLFPSVFSWVSVLLAGELLVVGFILARSGLALHKKITLVTDWFLPSSLALLIWVVRPRSHPRYLSPFAVVLFIFVAHSLSIGFSKSSWRRVWSAVTLVALLCVFGFSLVTWYTNPDFAKDDVDAVAAWLETRTSEGDLVISPSRDWTLDYAYEGEGSIFRPDPVRVDENWQFLASNTTAEQRVYLIRYDRGVRRAQDHITFALEAAGALVGRNSFRGISVEVYELEERVALPVEFTEETARFGALRLEGGWIEPRPQAGRMVAVALRWRMERAVDQRYRASFILRDEGGLPLSTCDDWLLDDLGRPTDEWKAGEVATTYHFLSLPVGTPPISYPLAVSVYAADSDGDFVAQIDLLEETGSYHEYRVGEVDVARDIGASRAFRVDPDAVSVPDRPIVLANNVQLEAFSLDREVVYPGQFFVGSLYWRTLESHPVSLPLTLRLSQGDRVLVEQPYSTVSGRYPMGRWRVEEVVLDRFSVTVPSDAEDGLASLTLVTPSHEIHLGDLQVRASERMFDPPPVDNEVSVRFGEVAELIGYSVDAGSEGDGERIAVELIWRALDEADERSYKVFTHLVNADGELVSQHDSRPVNGTRPTTGWLPSEILIDRREIDLSGSYTGPAQIRVGLYDPQTMERVMTGQERSFYVLPLELEIAGE